MASQLNPTASILALMALSGLALMPLGCGGAQEDYTVLSPSRSTSPSASDDATLPKSVIRQLEACAKRTTAAQVEASYAMLFDIEITPEGNVLSAKLRDSTLGDDDIESCMVHAFDDITLSVSAFALRSSRPASGGESMRDSRDKLGVAQAAGGVIALGPIVIAMGAAYILAQVTVQVVVPAIEATIQRRRRESACKKLWESCINFAPTQCLAQSAGKSFCTLCWERCNAGEIASPNCQICGF